MEYTALWGPKGFVISPYKIVPLMNLATSFAVKAENSNDAGGTAATNAKGRDLQTISFTTRYVRGAGVDPRGQIAEWEAQIGKVWPLYIAGQRFGPPKLMLKSVDVSDILLSNTGVFLQCDVSLKFEEYSTAKATSTTVASGPAANSKAAQVYNSLENQKSAALNATASPNDKAINKNTAKVAIT